jgi:phosphatidylserine decarboxylase
MTLEGFMLLILKFLPKNIVSRLTGWFVHQNLPKSLRIKSMRWFADRYKIDMNEAEFPLESYPHIGGLFTRRLKPGLRPIKGLMVHPCDGVLTEQGVIHNGRLLQVKGTDYAVSDFIKDPEKARALDGGYFLTYYLCPTDYHRVHSPISGEIIEAKHIPGTLWPVNKRSVQKIQNLFSINERLVIEIAQGKDITFAVMVGATNVGKMTASFDPTIVTNIPGIIHTKTYGPALKIQVGDELGIFHMGSTVVMLYPPGKVLNPPASGPVRLGETL